MVNGGGGVGGVDISMICSEVERGLFDEGNGGDVEGDGGRGSIRVLNA